MVVPRELNIFSSRRLLSHLGARYTRPFPPIPTRLYQKKIPPIPTYQSSRHGRPPPAASSCESAHPAAARRELLRRACPRPPERGPTRPRPPARRELPARRRPPTAASDLRFAARPPPVARPLAAGCLANAAPHRPTTCSTPPATSEVQARPPDASGPSARPRAAWPTPPLHQPATCLTPPATSEAQADRKEGWIAVPGSLQKEGFDALSSASKQSLRN